MGRFSDVAEAKPLTKLPWFPTGFSGALRILQCKCITGKTKQNTQTEFYIVEVEVVTSNLPDVPPGAHRSWTQDRKKAFVGAESVKLFIGAVMGIDANDPQITEEVIGASVGDYDVVGGALVEVTKLVPPKKWGEGFQPFAGKLVDLVTATIKTKANTDFTKHTWVHHNE